MPKRKVRVIGVHHLMFHTLTLSSSQFRKPEPIEGIWVFVNIFISVYGRSGSGDKSALGDECSVREGKVLEGFAVSGHCGASEE